jgi:pimeloyl-ACP methyl ester carboxylesterase
MREVHLYELNELQSVQGTPSQVIILIQGTFSRNASWTKPGSAFLKGIRKSAPNDSLILGFTWTGKNCALAREKAALKLRQHLLASAEKYPCAPHVLIGHSHGGNIALRAASKASTPVKIVCLSTPIIYSFPRPRSEAKNAKQVLWGLAVALLLPCILYVAGSRPGLGDGLVWALSFASATAAALIIFAGELHLKWSLSICEFSAVTEGINSASALFLRYPGDEASLALPSFQAIQYLINRLVETAAAIAMRLFNLNLVRRWRGLYFPLLLLLAAALGLPLLYVVHHIFEAGRPFRVQLSILSSECFQRHYVGARV